MIFMIFSVFVALASFAYIIITTDESADETKFRNGILVGSQAIRDVCKKQGQKSFEKFTMAVRGNSLAAISSCADIDDIKDEFNEKAKKNDIPEQDLRALCGSSDSNKKVIISYIYCVGKCEDEAKAKNMTILCNYPFDGSQVVDCHDCEFKVAYEVGNVVMSLVS